MKSKGIYVGLGILVAGALGGAWYLRSGEPQATQTSNEGDEPQRLASVERREQHVEKLQKRLRTIASTSRSKPTASVEVEAAPGETNDLVMVDVADLDESVWIQSMYDSAFRYEGRALTKEERAARERARVGVHTEGSMREKEDELVAAMPHMKAEIDAAREQREAEQKRFEKTGESSEARAAREGVQLEY